MCVSLQPLTRYDIVQELVRPNPGHGALAAAHSHKELGDMTFREWISSRVLGVSRAVAAADTTPAAPSNTSDSSSSSRST